MKNSKIDKEVYCYTRADLDNGAAFVDVVDYLILGASKRAGVEIACLITIGDQKIVVKKKEPDCDVVLSACCVFNGSEVVPSAEEEFYHYSYMVVDNEVVGKPFSSCFVENKLKSILGSNSIFDVEICDSIDLEKILK